MTNSRASDHKEDVSTFVIPVKTILNARDHIFLMPLGEPAKEADDYGQSVLPPPNSLMLSLVTEALKQHPTWLEKVELTPVSFGVMMGSFPEKIEKFKKHSQIKKFLQDRILLNGETALALAVRANNLGIVRW